MRGPDVAPSDANDGGALLPRGTTRLTAATFGAWIVLLALVGARAAGAPLPPGAVVAGAAIALATAVAVAFQTMTHAWRGPVVVDFRREEAVLCGPAEAEVVRAAALLRGTMGGAGYADRARLAFPAIASVAAAFGAGAAVADPALGSVPAWPFAVVALSVGAAALFPARPFYYREANGGSLLLHPRDAWARLERFSKGGTPSSRWIRPRFQTSSPDGRRPGASPESRTPRPPAAAPQGGSEP